MKRILSIYLAYMDSSNERWYEMKFVRLSFVNPSLRKKEEIWLGHIAKSPYINRNVKRVKSMSRKSSITQRLRTDLGRSVRIREKGRDLTQSYDKSPYTNRNIIMAKWQHNATKKFDYTAVADRLRTVSWSNYSHPTGVVNLVYGPNLPTPRNSRVIKRKRLKICK